MSLADFYVLLRDACAEAGGQSAWARKHGISVSHVSDVINTRSAPGPLILDALGLEPVPCFRRKKEAA
jgi:hypothetical protein